MADTNANININVNISDALAELRTLEKQLQIFNKSIVQGTALAKKVQNDFNSSLIHNINATGKFVASMGNVLTETERFTNALEKNKFSAREYFRYTMASTKTFGRLFGKEFGTITRVAEERVKQLQARHIELGRAADGAMRSIKIVPTSLDYSKPITQMQMAIMKQQIFNKLLDAGTTKLLNFGKNTQWAGRQLMVGFTIPLTILGSTAIRTFQDMEKQAIRFKKVYGDMFTATEDTNQALQNVKALANEFTKYGVAVADTMKLAADAAAAGNTGKELESVIKQSTRLSVLGGVAQDQALEATIAIKNAFKTTAEELDNTINFLNAVENQTVVALDDITEAIPKVAPVIQQLGGDVKDLAFFMAAMQEGGVNASEAANALKSGLASLINPTTAATKMAKELGINLQGIVDINAGDVRGMIISLAEAIRPLDDLKRAKLIEQIFGKYQFARISTLLDNVARSGNQASRVLSLTTASVEELGIMAERELGITAESSATKFAAAMEKLKAQLAPVGEQFIKALLPLIEFGTKILEKFNSLSDGTKQIITRIVAIVGGLGPVLLMGIGLVANGIANLLKGVGLIRKGYQALTGSGKELGLSTQYLTQEQLEALSAAQNLHSAHQNLTSQFALEANSLLKLTTAYREAAMAAQAFATANPGMMKPGTASKLNKPKFGGKKFADGGWVPGSGNKDTVPAVLMPGEFVVSKKAAQANSQTLEAMNKGGQAYRGAGTPTTSKGFEYRSVGSQSSNVVFAHIQDSIGQLAGNTLYKLLDITTTDKVFDPLRVAQAAGIDLSGLKSVAIVSGDLGLPLDKELNSKLMTANFDTDGTKGVSGADLKKSLLASIDDESSTSIKKRARLARALGINTKSSSGKEASKLLFDEIKKQVSVFIDDDATYSDKGNKFHKSFYATGESIVDAAAGKVPLTDAQGKKQNPKKLIAEAKKIIGEVRMQFYNPLLSLLEKQGIVKKLPNGDWQVVGGLPKNHPLMNKIISAKNTPRILSPQFTKAIGASVMPMGSQTPKPPTMPKPRVRGVRRAGGTPAYGEQKVTPAMLTPGEFVMNAKSAQENGPLLQAINAGGGVAYRALGDPSQEQIDNMWGGKVPTPEEARWSTAYTKKLNELTNNNPNSATAQQLKQAGAYADIVEPKGRAQTPRQKARSVLGGAKNKITSAASNLPRMTMPMPRGGTQTTNTGGGNPSGGNNKGGFGSGAAAGNIAFAGFAISGMMSAMAQTDTAAGRLAKSMEQYAYMLSTGIALMPLLNSKMGAATVVLAAGAAAWFYMTSQINKGADEAKKMVDQMSVTTQSLQKMEEMTGRPSLSGLTAAKRLAGASTLNPIKSDFGNAFIGTDLGKQMLAAAEKGGPEFAKSIGIQLSTYMSEGLITANDAKSIAQSIADSLQDQSLSVKITGVVDEITGPNGVNLLADPVGVRMEILKKSQEENQRVIEQLKKETEQAYKGFATFNNPLGGEKVNAAGTVMAGMGVGALTGSAFGPIGTVVGTIVGGIAAYGVLIREQAKAAKLASKLGTFQAQSAGQMIKAAKTMKDSLEAETDQRVQNIDRLKEELDKKLKLSTDAKERLAIESKLIQLDSERKGVIDRSQQGQKDLQEQVRQTYISLNKMYQNAPTDSVREAMITASQTAITDKYKDTPLAPTIELIKGLLNEIDNKTLQLRINTAISSEQLSPSNAATLLQTFAGNENELDRELQLWINIKGIEDLDRLTNTLSLIDDPEQQKRIMRQVRAMNQEGQDYAINYLETVGQLAGDKVDGKIVFDQNKEIVDIDNTEMILAGKSLEKINGLLKDLAKTKDQANKKKLVLDFVTQNKEFIGLEDKVDWFLSLDENNQRTFTTVFNVLETGVTDKDIKERASEIGKSVMAQGKTQAELEAMAARSLQIENANLAMKYVQQNPTGLQPGPGGPEDTTGGGSIPITTAQLIELRLKGLDPAAASQLDGAQAAQILSGSVKEQKNAIKSLNAELRQNAMQNELLKSDQQVLNETMDALSNSVGAYIEMLQEMDIKPIQEQISKYNELTNKQQDQIDKYQYGLQNLYKKEDEINKVYDARITAIDKVAQANERASESRRQQIDLASALTSGDFGAAAQAAAAITNTQAQYQLEDARASLEKQRQEEISALTFEINGQYYTREQIENNINNLEEEIYQRSILIKAEQQKIADIEKTITAEKEKQRKLQVLAQISSLSERMQTTVNQTQREAMMSQIDYLGQSVGMNVNDPESVTKLGESLGVNTTAVVNSLLQAQKTANLTSEEFAKEFEKAKNNAGDISRFYDSSSLEAQKSLGYITSLSSLWAGDEKTGLGGMRETGKDILDSLSSASNSIKIGKDQINSAVTAGIVAINNAASKIKYTRGFGGMIGYAYGGNVNYKGSTEPAPVRMAIGNIVPGIGNSDKVPALLTPGEFVVRKSVAQENLGFLKALNGDVFPTMGSMANSVVTPSAASNVVSNISSPVYNYSVNVNVPNTTSSPNEIADVVMNKIRLAQGREIKGNRF